MRRWWDDPDLAGTVLAGVDDSNLEQGVGTAVLGLHALAKDALAPLVGRTLVDRADIVDALAHLPLEPVSKALAQATRPVMGAGADRYGVLLATELSDRGRDGALALANTLLAQGLPMPLAVQRVAEVAGLPPDRMGAYAAVTKDATAVPVVVADAADRALMGYAAHLARRENTAQVVHKGVDFESEHPRGQAGRFAEKGGEIDPRTARRARRERFLGLQRRSVPRPAQAARADLSELAELVRATEPEPEPERARERRRPSLARLAATVRAAPEPAKKTPATLEYPLAEPAPASAFQDFAMAINPAGAMYLPVSTAVARQIEAGGFTMHALKAALRDEAHVYSGNHYPQLIKDAMNRGLTDYSDIVMLEFPRQVPVTDTSGTWFQTRAGTEIANQAVFRPEADSRGRWEYTSFNEPHGPDEAQNRAYGYARERYFPTLKVRLDDVPDKPEDVEGGKAADEVWDVGGHQVHRQVTRDEEGQFATGGGGAEARAKRRARRNRFYAHHASAQRAQPRQAVTNQQSLSELVAALQGEQQAVEAPRERTRQRQRQFKTPLKAVAAVAGPAQERAATDFERASGALLSFGQLDALFPEGALDLFDRADGNVVARAVPDIDETMPHGLETTTAPRALDTWVKNGDDTHQISGHPTLEEARAFAIDWIHGAYEHLGREYQRQVADERLEGVGEPKKRVFLRPVGTETGKTRWQVHETTYAEEKILLYGEPDVLAAVGRRDGKTKFRLELVAETMRDLGDKVGLTPGAGSQVVPVVAIKVTRLDDKQ